MFYTVSSIKHNFIICQFLIYGINLKTLINIFSSWQKYMTFLTIEKKVCQLKYSI